MAHPFQPATRAFPGIGNASEVYVSFATNPVWDDKSVRFCRKVLLEFVSDWDSFAFETTRVGDEAISFSDSLGRIPGDSSQTMLPMEKSGNYIGSRLETTRRIADIFGNRRNDKLPYAVLFLALAENLSRKFSRPAIDAVMDAREIVIEAFNLSQISDDLSPYLPIDENDLKREFDSLREETMENDTLSEFASLLDTCRVMSVEYRLRRFQEGVVLLSSKAFGRAVALGGFTRSTTVWRIPIGLGYSEKASPFALISEDFLVRCGWNPSAARRRVLSKRVFDGRTYLLVEGDGGDEKWIGCGNAVEVDG